jgi:sarcosine oxidase subunit beta
VSRAVAVVGAGAVGTTLAGDLADRGCTVTLYDRDRVGAGASGRAAGVVYDAYTDHRDVELAQRSLERFRATDAFEPCPYVIVSRTGGTEGPALAALADGMTDRGVRSTHCDGRRLGERFPAVETGTVADAVVVENAGLVDAPAYVDAMAARARERGVTVETGTAVELRGPRTLAVDGRERAFDAVAVTAGAATAALLSAVGIDIPLGYYRAQVLVTESVAASPPSVYDATDEYYLRPWDGGVLLGDGVDPTAAPGAWDRGTDPAFRARGRERLAATLGVSPAIERSWAGLCTATPDRTPMVGRVAEGLFVATGFHGHGLLRAPAVAEALAAQLLGASGISGFDPKRFPAGATPTLPTGAE